MVILPLIASAFVGQLSTIPPFSVSGGNELFSFNSYYVNNSIELNNNGLDTFSIGGFINRKEQLDRRYESYVLDFAFSIDKSDPLNFYVNGVKYVGFRPYAAGFNPSDNENADFSIQITTIDGSNSVAPGFNIAIYPTYSANPNEGYECMQQLGIKFNSFYLYEPYMTKKDSTTKYVSNLEFNGSKNINTFSYHTLGNYYLWSFSANNLGNYSFNSVNSGSFNHMFQFYSTYSKSVGTYEDGYNVGYDLGYNTGYTEGVSKSIDDVNPLVIAFNSIGRVLNIEIFPGFRISYAVGFGFACGLVLLILKFFH